MEKETKKMVFLAHWVEGWNLLLWFSKYLRKNPEKAWLFFPLYPICWVVSLFWLAGKKSFDVVDDFSFKMNGGKVLGKTVLIRNFGLHFFLPAYRPRIQQRILDTICKVQGNTDVVGLGALTKDERVTQGGKFVVEELGERLRVPIIHGDTLTAAVVFQQIIALRKKYNIKSPVFLTGSTSKIGRAVALSLARGGITVKMFTKDYDRFKMIAVEADSFSKNLVHTNSLEQGKDCSLWITGKAVPAGKNLLQHIPKGAVVINFAVPNPLKRKHLKNREDIISFEGGLLAYDPQKTNLSFTMRLSPGITYACHAATLLHAYKGWKHHEVDVVDIGEMESIWKQAKEAGFFLPPI